MSIVVWLLCAVVYIHSCCGSCLLICFHAESSTCIICASLSFSGIAESPPSTVEHHLTGKELLALKNILQEDVIDTLEQNLAKSGSVTIEEVQRLLHSLDQHEIASSLDFGKLVNAVLISAILYIILMRRKVTVYP